MQVGGAVFGTVVDKKRKVSSIPESGLEISSLLHFTHPCKEMLEKMKGFVEKQLSRSKESFKFDKDTCSDSDDEEGHLAESDLDDEEKTRESNELPEESSNKASNKENCKSNNKEKKK